MCKTVQDCVRATGDEFLRDCLRVNAGEVWSESIKRMIEEADIFQLFWSTNAMESSYVESEWRYALGLGRSGFIRPLYWEEPLPTSPERDLPPEELRRIHFHKLTRVSPTEETTVDSTTYNSSMGLFVVLILFAGTVVSVVTGNWSMNSVCYAFVMLGALWVSWIKVSIDLLNYERQQRVPAFRATRLH